MKKRTINNQLLKELVHEIGIGKFSDDTGVSISWLQKAMAGCYMHEPRRLIREAICNNYAVNENKLFPAVPAKGKAS